MTQAIEGAVSYLHDGICNLFEDTVTFKENDTTMDKVLRIVAGLLISIPVGFSTAVVTATRIAHAFNASVATPKTPIEKAAQDSRHWETIDVSKPSLPEGILKGVATCDYQYLGMNGAPNSQWVDYEKKFLPESKRSTRLPPCWEPDKIVELIKKLNVNTFRFSVEWSNIEPELGKWNEKALDRYVELCKKLKAAGIEPFVTLHHFSEPKWFNFEKAENIPHFVKFSEKVAEKLGPYVTYWNTINEPGVYSFMGYILGQFPPKIQSPHLAGTVLRNMLQAHCEVYEKLKGMNPKSQIGIAHQALKFVPYWSWIPFDRIFCHYLTRITHETIMKFFETGKYEWKLPFSTKVFWEKRDVQNYNDFFGVQAYTRSLNFFGMPTCYSSEMMTGMPFREDPAAIFEASKECAQRTKKPIIITETGIYPRSDEQRKRFLERNVYAISQLPNHGVNLKGVCFWSLYKNFEWQMGMGPDFGLLRQVGNGNDFELHRGAEAVKKAFQSEEKSEVTVS